MQLTCVVTDIILNGTIYDWVLFKVGKRQVGSILQTNHHRTMTVLDCSSASLS